MSLPAAVLAECVRVYIATDRALAHRQKGRRYQYAVEDVLAAVRAQEAATTDVTPEARMRMWGT